MSAPNLQLFPNTAAAPSMPRKSSLKSSRSQEQPPRPEVQIQATRKIEPAEDHIKHSLFCQPEKVSPTASGKQPLRSAMKTRRRSTELDANSPAEDQLAPLPSQHDIRSSSPAMSIGRSASQRKRAAPPRSITVSYNQAEEEALIASEKDQLSPLPDKISFHTPVSSSTEYPHQLPLRSSRSSPSLGRSNSTASSSLPAYESPPTEMKSIFPTFDQSRPLNQQQYYPRTTLQPTGYPPEKANKTASPVEKQPLRRVDSAMDVMTEGYEHVTVATNDDLLMLWGASVGRFPRCGRKVQLQITQPQRQGTSLSLGTSFGQTLYTLSSEKDESKAANKITITKQHPEDKTIRSAAQLEIPTATPEQQERHPFLTSIFPHLAALKAIEIVASSPQASAIAHFDPQAASPDAARLARSAISMAREAHEAELVRNTRKRDSLGAVCASYELHHPSLGNFPVTVSRSRARYSQADPRAKISLHHPSATPAAIAAETLVLASLDFAKSSCILDMPGLMALDSSYILDTVISALLAVVVAENDNIVAEAMKFDPPPKTPVQTRPKQLRKSSSRSVASADSSRSKRWYKSSEKKKKDEVEKKPTDDLPVLAKGTIALVGFSLKTAVFVLETGLKVTAGLVVGASHLAKKL